MRCSWEQYNALEPDQGQRQQMRGRGMPRTGWRTSKPSRRYDDRNIHTRRDGVRYISTFSGAISNKLRYCDSVLGKAGLWVEIGCPHGATEEFPGRDSARDVRVRMLRYLCGPSRGVWELQQSIAGQAGVRPMERIF